MGWWRERSAIGFMKRVGVVPNMNMGRAVWLRDVEAWAGNSSVVAVSDGGADQGARKCVDTFNRLLNEVDLAAAPSESAGSLIGGTKQRSRRLQRTRTALGGYRHDLLVALRVVNRIEKEVVEAEWEAWVRDEVRKCGQLEVMLHGKGANSSVDSKKGSKDKQEKLQVMFGDLATDQEVGLEKWYQSYCGSCRIEWEGLKASGGDFGTTLL